MAVYVPEEPVMGDELAGRNDPSEYAALQAAVLPHALGPESLGIQLHVGVHYPIGGGSRQIHLIEAVVGLVPECRAPGVVEFIYGSVSLFHKSAEGRMVRFAVELVGLAVELVVYLPAYDAVPAAVVLCDLLYDDRGLLTVYPAVVVVVPPEPVSDQSAVLEGVEHLRILLCEPCGRSCRGSAEDDLYICLLSDVQKAVEEGEVENSLLRLELIPCKFCDPDDGYAVFQHPSQVVRPQFAGPVFRVIAGAESEFSEIETLIHLCFLP